MMRRSSFQGIDLSIAREVQSEYDNIRIVADNIDSISSVAASLSNLPLLSDQEGQNSSFADNNVLDSLFLYSISQESLSNLIYNNTLAINELKANTSFDVSMDIHEYTAYQGQSEFSLKYGYNKVEVFMNGINLINRGVNCEIDDYILTPLGIKLTLPAFVNDRIRVIGYDYQGDIYGTLFPMTNIYPSDDLYPTNQGCFSTNTESAPSVITDLNGTVDLTDSIQFTWSLSTVYPEVSYALYSGTVLLSSNITSGYIYDITGPYTSDFYVIAYNTVGSSISNVVSATAAAVNTATIPTAPSNVLASQNFVDKIVFTWDSSAGYPIPTYDLYKNGLLVKSNITTGYEYLIAGYSSDTYVVKSINTEGEASSTSVTGIALQNNIYAEQCLAPSDNLYPDNVTPLTPKPCL